MKKMATLSTIIDADVKRAATEYCKNNGMKLQFLVERALIEQLEDAIDLQAYKDRQNESTISLEDILKSNK